MFEISRGALYPVLPLRDIVVFPHMVVPLFVGREKSVRALEEVMKDDKQILLVTQKNAAQDDPGPADIYDVGTDRHGAAAAEAARRHGEGAGRGRPARAHPALHRQRGVLPGRRRGRSRTRPASSRSSRRCRAAVVAVRALRQAQQEDSARGAGLDQPDRRSGEARRHASPRIWRSRSPTSSSCWRPRPCPSGWRRSSA